MAWVSTENAVGSEPQRKKEEEKKKTLKSPWTEETLLEKETK